jgi:hypothetical protein
MSFTEVKIQAELTFGKDKFANNSTFVKQAITPKKIPPVS